MKDSLVLENKIIIPNIAIGCDNQDCETFAALAIKHGFRFFDTAYMYLSEQKLGLAIEKCIKEGLVTREELFIQSKIPHTKAGYKVTLNEFENSLNRLKIDYLNSYLIHYPQRDKENWQDLLLDTWCAMEKLYKEGKVKVIGVSNFLEHHLDFLIKNCEIKPMINQIEIHPEHPQEKIVKYCNENNIILQAWSPFGSGRSYYNEQIKFLSNKYSTTITNFVLNWHKQRNIIPIVGVHSESEIIEIKNFKEISIQKEDIEILKNLKENYSNCHNDATLVDWIPAIPATYREGKISSFVPTNKIFKLFGIIPFFKIQYKSLSEVKYYLFNILICKTQDKIYKENKTRWTKEDKNPGKYKIERVFNNKNKFMECPVWNPIDNLICCICPNLGEIYQINEKQKKIDVLKISNQHLGCIDIDKNGNIIAACTEGIFKLNPKENKKEFLIQLKPEIKYNFDQAKVNYNDGKLDAKGRFVVGTMSNYNNNKLYSFDGKKIEVLENNITCSNGIAWSKDNTIMYYTDSATKKVAKYNYDIETGNAYFDIYIYIEIENGTPDGMCIDVDDNLWIAEFDGKKVSKWDTKTFEKIEEINFPVYVTSCCLGGKDLNYLYITTSQTENSKKSSGLFKVKIR